ncbi:hypothetical protein QW131_27705 [Roseibium salinum]|nr:hypothetical protein [Roseibium salinum]
MRTERPVSSLKETRSKETNWAESVSPSISASMVVVEIDALS